MNRTGKPMKSKRIHRHGITVTELVVSASLLVSAMAVVAPLAIQSTRIWQDTRKNQMVIDELSGQLERLIHLDPVRRREAIESLRPSDHVRSTLPSAEIEAHVVRDGSGVRIVVSLDWDRLGDPKPVSLVGWLDPVSTVEQDAEVTSTGDRTQTDSDEVSS